MTHYDAELDKAHRQKSKYLEAARDRFPENDNQWILWDGRVRRHKKRWKALNLTPNS